MRRRSFMGGLLGAGAVTVPGLAAAASAKKRPRVGVVGGGILGASIAVHLIDAGADVVVFEKNTPASGATQASLAWINASTVNTHYRDLRLSSMAAWRELDKRLRLGVIWGGSISWSNIPAKVDNLKKREVALRNTAADPLVVDARKITELSPCIAPGDTGMGFFLPHDGHIDPVDVTLRMLSYAKTKGAQVIYPCAITGIDMVDGAVKVVKTSQGEFPVDQLVVAAGADTPGLMDMLGFKLTINTVPGLNVHTKVLPHQTDMVYDVSSALEFKQMPNGEAVVIYVGGPPKQLPVHDPVYGRAITAYPSPELAAMHAKSLLGKAAVYWPALANAEPDKIRVGFRPVPADGLPVIGPVPGAKNAYVVATHSGVTLAPILGQHAAAEVLGGAPAAILAPYRPDRFTGEVKAGSEG
ncbi:NAD(P)/FAD-dependent oxidoreductase [Duganella aceris]|uniref:FAD-binding oxidoreductase n=1 Tax=Duganella aceris TaxID=2703883 RepID=A0ABX0FHB4_9BURK|nr:FAD-binding oxidoreductase [Duganella aceris]NGZ83957.1 FAD-binding oxidoreductase [Duganella aceris]